MSLAAVFAVVFAGLFAVLLAALFAALFAAGSVNQFDPVIQLKSESEGAPGTATSQNATIANASVRPTWT